MLNSPCTRGNYQSAEVDQVQHQEQEHRSYQLEQEMMENPLCRNQMSCVGPIKKNQAEKQAFSYIKTAQCGSNTLDSSTQEVEGVGFLSSRPGWLI